MTFGIQREKIRDRIKRNRIAFGLSQSKLSELIDVKDRSTLANWEDGIRLPELKNFCALCEVFNCELGYLLCEHDCKTKAATDIQEVTGLSESAITVLKNLNNKKSVYSDLVIEFYNLLIETSKQIYGQSENLSKHLPDLPFHSIDHIVGTHSHHLWLEYGSGVTLVLSGFRSDSQYENVNFRIYQLTKDFENWIEYFAKDTDIRKRLEKIYTKHKIEPPVYGHFENTRQKTMN